MASMNSQNMEHVAVLPLPINRKQPSHLPLHILCPRNPIQPRPHKLPHPPHPLHHPLHLLQTHPNPPAPPYMPRRLQRQILNHDTRQHHNLRIHIIQHLPIAQIQPIRNLCTNPPKILMRVEQSQRLLRIMRVYLLQPRHAPLVIRLVVRPLLPAEAEVAVLGALELRDGDDRLERLAHADDGDELDEGFAQGADQGLPRGRGLVRGLRDQVRVEVRGEEGLRAADEGREREEVPAGGEGGGGEGLLEEGEEGGGVFGGRGGAGLGGLFGCHCGFISGFSLGCFDLVELV